MQSNISTQQAQVLFNTIQANIQASRQQRMASMSAAGLVPTTPAPAPQPTQAEIVASLQDAAHVNDVNRFAALSRQLVAAGRPQHQALRAAAFPTSGGAWGAAQTLSASGK